MLTDKMEINATSALKNMYILQCSTHLSWKQHLWWWINENDIDTQTCSFGIDMCCALNDK